MKKISLLILVSLLLSLNNEEPLIGLLSQKLNDFNKVNPHAQVHLVFSQNKYVPGDTIFFSAYLFSEELLPIKGRRVLPLELFNQQGEAAQSINFEVNNGRGYNQLVVPSSVAAGRYQLVVRSQLLNQPSLVDLFSKEIIIVEKNGVMPSAPKSKNSISVFPEGGNLVGNVDNNIIIKSDFRGSHRIKNRKDEIITDFSVDETGYAKVNFTPELDGEYYVEAEGHPEKFSIEKAKEEGCSLQLSVPIEGPVNVKLSIPSKSRKLKELYAVVVSRRKIIFSAATNFENTNTSQINIPKENLHDGLNQLTVFDKEGTLLADRIFMINRNNVTASITLLNKTLKQREKIEVETLLKDKYGNPLVGNFTLSVVQKKFFVEPKVLSFREELFLSSIPDLKNEILETVKTAKEFSSHLDNLMVANPWKMIPWKELLAGNKIPAPVIKTYLSLKGRAMFKNSDKSVPDSTLLAGYLQNNMMGYETYTKEGRFELKFAFNFWGEDELFYLMEKGKSLGEDYLIVPDKFVPPTQSSRKEFFLKDSLDLYADYKSKKKIVRQSYNFFSGSQNKIAAYKDLNAQFEEEAEGADFITNVQDYVVFPTMEDLIREVIPFLEYRKKNATIRLLLPHTNGNVRPKGEPLFVIDGVLTRNKNIFLGLKPSDILFIKLINNPNKLSKWGVLGKNGIVLVTTKSASPLVLEEKASFIKIIGLSKPLDFISPDYSKFNNARVPDLRTLLCWAPFISTSSAGKVNLEFFTSDDIGVFELTIKGITSQGEPFDASTSFEVKFKE